jgi:hypothetical protein
VPPPPSGATLPPAPTTPVLPPAPGTTPEPIAPLAPAKGAPPNGAPPVPALPFVESLPQAGTSAVPIIAAKVSRKLDLLVICREPLPLTSAASLVSMRLA